MIFHNLERIINWLRDDRFIVMTSGFYAPIHAGHILYLRKSALAHYTHVAVVNGDNALKAKKGYVVMPALERAEIVHAVKGVEHVLIWDESDVAGVIRGIKPYYFMKGGDRSDIINMNKDELEACKQVKCIIKVGIGGKHKFNSSSNIIQNILANHPRRDII